MRSAWWFVVAGAVALGGIVAAAFDLMPRLGALEQAVVRFEMPGSGVLKVDRAGTYTVYRETQANGLRLSIVAPSGRAVALAEDNGRSSYTIEGRHGTSIFTFQVQELGDYRLTGTREGGDGRIVLAVEHGLIGGLFRTVMRTMAIVLAGFALAGIIVVLTIWQRTRKR